MNNKAPLVLMEQLNTWGFLVNGIAFSSSLLPQQGPGHYPELQTATNYSFIHIQFTTKL